MITQSGFDNPCFDVYHHVFSFTSACDDSSVCHNNNHVHSV